MAESRRQAAERADASTFVSPFPFAPGRPLLEVAAFSPSYGGEIDRDNLTVILTLHGTAEIIQRSLPNSTASRQLIAAYAAHAAYRSGVAL